MKINKLLILSLVFLLVISFTINLDAFSNKKEIKIMIQKIIDKKVENTELPGVAVHIRGGKLGDIALTSGKISLDSEKEIRKDTQFRIGSMTKSFTAAAILKLYENGELDLDKEIINYIDLKYDKFKKITVRDLLHMTSGLGDYLRDTDHLIMEVLENPKKNYNSKYLAIYGTNLSENLKFKPGSKFNYSNTNYILLGMIIENISGISYEKYIKKNFIEKYNLDNTIVKEGIVIPDNLARGYYDRDRDGKPEDWTNINSSYVWSAGEIISTASDIAKWLDLYTSGQLFNKRVNKEIYRGTEIAKNVIYSTGLSVTKNRIGHNGTVIGYHSDMWYNRKTGVTITVLSNISGKEDYTRQLVNEIFKLLE